MLAFQVLGADDAPGVGVIAVGQLRSEWQSRKTALSKAGVSTSFLSEDFGPKLDDFESAMSKYEKAREKKSRSDPSLQPLRANLKTALGRVARTALSYEKQLRYMADNAREAQQKTPLSKAAAFLLHFMNSDMKKAQSYL